AVSSDLDLDAIRIFISHLKPGSLLHFYHPLPVYNSTESLCSSISSGAFTALLPFSSWNSHLILSSLSTKIGLFALSITPPRPSRLPSVTSLHPSQSVLPQPIVALLTQYFNATGNAEVAILYENPEDTEHFQYLLTYPIQAYLVKLPDRNNDDFKPALKHVSIKLGVPQIVVFLSPDRISSLLRQAASMNMCTAHYHYVLANLENCLFDSHSSFRLISSIRNLSDTCNITTFSLHSPHDSRVAEIRSILAKEGYGKMPYQGLTTELTLLWDALTMMVETVDQIGVRGEPSCDEYTDEWEHGETMVEYAEQLRLHGVSGPLLFDSRTGQRINETIRVWTTTNCGKMEQNIDWSMADRRFIVNISTASHDTQKKKTLENHTLSVTVYLEEPFVMKRNPRDGEILEGNDRYEGYCIDLLKMIASILKFDYVLYEVPDRAYGIREASGKWNGMVGELQSGEADLAVASLTISYSRTAVIDFTVPYMHLGISILFRRTERVFFPLNIPRSSLSHCMVECISCLSHHFHRYFLSLTNLERDESTGSYRSIKNQFTLRNAFWFSVSSLMQQGSELSPRAGSVRIATAAWWMFTLILISSYTANLAAFLTTRRMASPIENADDLSKQSKIKFGTLGRGSTMTFFNESRVDTYERMWKMMNSAPGLFVESSAEGIARVRSGDYAYLMESSMLEYAVERDCRLVQIGGLLDQKGYGIGLPKGSPYREPISTAILQLQEKTLLTELKEKWWKDSSVVCDRPSTTKSDETETDSIAGVFVLLLIGMLISIGIAVGERISRSCRKEQQNEQGAAMERSLWLQLRDALWERSRENESIKRTIDTLIRDNYHDGRPQSSYENSDAIAKAEAEGIETKEGT
ncbi:hypothetical protein PFISCL1PPCAC_2262, partial [Pristionchus fissidentatus]